MCNLKFKSSVFNDRELKLLFLSVIIFVCLVFVSRSWPKIRMGYFQNLKVRNSDFVFQIFLSRFICFDHIKTPFPLAIAKRKLYVSIAFWVLPLAYTSRVDFNRPGFQGMISEKSAWNSVLTINYLN